ncbi:hypothetical protein A3K81_00710 [Candidatus Bathyarchaeota archaeon RBG_13_60_20]|jgi:hypothetical protein|nr:MAG: hypothetical protein A3K81_00710 [Candidatus Bathyarchaeota archaeon RBG_13_60_20]
MSEKPLEKLVFGGSDFKFVAAYKAYSDAFDAADEERRASLNEAISKLHGEEMGYPEFYAAVNAGGEVHRFHRSQISTSRKFAYREAERKADRIKRHK